MTPSDKNDVFHAFDSQALLLREPHGVVDVAGYPFSEISESDGVLSLG
jgi:hypothetical protein